MIEKKITVGDEELMTDEIHQQKSLSLGNTTEYKPKNSVRKISEENIRSQKSQQRIESATTTNPLTTFTTNHKYK